MDDLFDLLRDDLMPDGALRDVLVPRAGRRGWGLLLQALESGPYPSVYTIDGHLQTSPPANLADVEKVRAAHGCLLQVKANAEVTLNAHFFTEAEIEFDADPAQLGAPANVKALVTFMRWLSDVTGQPVILTYEGAPTSKFLEVDGDTTTTF